MFTGNLLKIRGTLTIVLYDEFIKKEELRMLESKEVYQLSQSKKMMVFVLSMSLYGLATLFTELIPSIHLGVIEFSVEYFAFIPLTLAILFDPFSAAIGAATGEVVFSEIMLGQFSGLGEVEKFILFSLGIYVAGMLVKNPLNKRQVAVASITGIAIHQILGAVVDILKVVLAVEDFEVVTGLPQSVVFVELFSALNDILFSGILFCVLPTLYLVPRLYGKIEPLLGVRKRTPQLRPTIKEVMTGKFLILSVLLMAIATTMELASTVGVELISFEASWAESILAYAVGILVALAIVLFLVVKLKENNKLREEEA